MDPRAIALVDKIMEPASWFATFFYKPIYVLRTIIIVIPWKIKTRISITKTPVFSFIQALRTSPPPFPTNNLNIAAAGFCWGGKHTMLLAQDAPSSRVHRHESQINSAVLEPLIDCAFTAHPSYIDVPNDIEAITTPISVAVGDEDTAMKASLIQQMKEMLEVKKKGHHEVNIIPGAKHGFAVRTHPDDKLEMECAEKAEVQVIEWFTRWFA
jgi:dienelactone hydrolase